MQKYLRAKLSACAKVTLRAKESLCNFVHSCKFDSYPSIYILLARNWQTAALKAKICGPRGSFQHIHFKIIKI